MTESTPNLGLQLMQQSQAQKHVTFNEALSLLDGVTQLVLRGVNVNTPPALPEIGDVYAIGQTPVNDWAAQAGMLAQRRDTSWYFFAPQAGWLAWVAGAQSLYVHDGSGWTAATQTLGQLGINATADANNRLTVASDVALFNHDGASSRVKINKAQTADTASILFQSDWTGHAELGLTGANDLQFKVSQDGASWLNAMQFDTTTGHATGTSVQSGPSDATQGRLLRTGAFGLGNVQDEISELSDFDAYDTPEGTWRFTTNTQGTRPAAANGSQGLVEIRRQTDQSLRQVLSRRNGTKGIWWRSCFDGVWNDWKQIHDDTTVLGQVSMQTGIPSGALFETGENSNGIYIRYADGTQICSLSGFASIAGGVATWAYPAEFSAQPSVCATVRNGSPRYATVVSPTTTSTGVATWDETGANTVNPFVNLIAIGRWI